MTTSRLGSTFAVGQEAVGEVEEREVMPTETRPAGRVFHAFQTWRCLANSITNPKSAEPPTPLQAYFRINAENMGQFERTLIIVDEDAYVHYVEGCTAPIYSSDSLHSAVVEIVVKKGGRCRYTTIQNWSNNVYNLVTKRAVAYENATMEWVDGNLGSKVTMKYPAVWLMGEGAHGERMIVSGFVEPITKELPLEYAVEMNRLIQLQMEGSVG